MFNPLGAISAGVGGFYEGMREADEASTRRLKKQLLDWDVQGREALGRALGGAEGLSQNFPQPPMPGEPSQPRFAGPEGQTSVVGPMPASPAPPGGAGAPPGSPAPSAATPGGLPQLDLATLQQRIKQANPNLPPQAMLSALNTALPLLNAQGKYDLAKMNIEMRREMLDLRERRVDLQERQSDRADKREERRTDYDQRRIDLAEKREQRLTSGGAVEGSGFTPGALDVAAENYFQTGKLPPNSGRGTQGSSERRAIINRAAELHPDSKPSEWPSRWQQFGAEATGRRALELRAANLILSEQEVRTLIPRVTEASRNVSRTEFPSINAIIMAAQRGTGDPNVIRLGIAINSLIYVYAKAMKPTGVLNEADTKRAQDILQAAWSQGQVEAALDQMMREIDAAKEGLQGARRELIPGRGGAGAPGGGGGTGNDPLGIR